MASRTILNLPRLSGVKWWKRGYTIALVVLLSVLIHAWAVWQLPLDYDEPVYMRAGQIYSQQIKLGDFQGVINYSENREHPALVKLLYSIPFYFSHPAYGTQPELYVNRGISALFGVLAVLVVSLVDPLAGFFLAMNSLVIKYTSQAYLEALPLFAALVALLAFRQAVKPPEEGQQPNVPWLWISAVALGVTAASKYNYIMIVLPIGFLAITSRRISWKRLLIYAVVAVLTFWALDPYLWRDPINRLVNSLVFHARYTQTANVQSYDYPWYQPLVWISQSVPWHPSVFFFITLDAVVFWVGLLGFSYDFRRRTWLPVWFFTNLLLLLIWPTKWPQYALILVPPLCLMAADFTRWLVGWGKEQNQYWDYLEEMLPTPPKIFWFLLVGFLALIGLGKVGYEYQRALERRGWIHLQAATSPLPADTINDISVDPDGRIVLGTASGLAYWNPSENVPWGEDIVQLTTSNSNLPGNSINALLFDRENHLWIGTNRGLSLVEGDQWTTYHASDMGLAGDDVRSIAEDSQGGIWVGTILGAAHWDGQQWQSYTQANQQLLDDAVFTIAVQPVNSADQVWFGSRLGVSHLDTRTGEWTREDFSARNLGWSGVSDLMVDSSGQLWVATLGGGLGKWTGQEWQFIRPSGSEIPSDMVKTIIETSPGFYWLGFAYSTEPGGMLATYDGQNWQRYVANNSGYDGGEPQTIVQDPQGRIWIGTLQDGLQIFEPAKK